MHPDISIIIPSRLAPVDLDQPGTLWLQQAVASIQQQTVRDQVEIEILVGIDHGMSAPREFANADNKLSFVPAPANSTGQVASVNQAVAQSRGQYLAFLEDDDRWHPNFLKRVLGVIAERDFVSSSQLEVLPNGPVIRIFDFPTPAGWFMRRELWDEMGGLNPEYKYHFDNDWLGRITNAGKRRVHLVEAGAPLDPEKMRTTRPDLHRVKMNSAIGYLAENVPLVTRTVNPQGGMTSIKTNSEAASRSREERIRLAEIYGRVPW
jgi:glycosyltransferase involved in cell wall biosynthesis